MKKPFNLFNKIRAAMRQIYRFSPMRREAIKKAQHKTGWFWCKECTKEWPIQMGEVDHVPMCGSLQDWDDLAPWAGRLFEGNVRVICKLCHKKVTAAQRGKKKKNG